MTELTTEEKIDYIYKTLKKQESRVFWGAIFKWGFRLLIILFLMYAYYYILPGVLESIREAMTPKIPTDSINFDSVKKLFSK